MLSEPQAESWQMIQTRRLQELGLVPKFTGDLAGHHAILWAAEHGMLGFYDQPIPPRPMLVDVMWEPPFNGSGERIAGAVKGDKEHAVESLWSACSDFMAKLSGVHWQAGQESDDTTFKAVQALKWVVERAMREAEERL